MQTRTFRITLSFIAGIILGHGSLLFPFSAGGLIVAALIVAGILSLAGSPRTRFLVLILPFCAGMLSYAFSAAYFPPDHYSRFLEADNRTHALTGSIVSPLDRDISRTAFVLDLRELDDERASGRMRVSVRDGLSSVGYGDIVRVRGRIYEPRGFLNPGGFDYAAYLARQEIFAAASVRSFADVAVLHRSRSAFRRIQDWRERIRQQLLGSTTGPGSAILQAMVLGEEGCLTDDIRDRFMAAGVTHILSISGSHLGLVALVCFGLMRWLQYLLPEAHYLRLTIHADPRKIAAALTLVPVVFYALLAGGQVATLRSLVMILAALAAVLLDRENGLMHSLAVAALIILAADPQALFDISFQLSYLSVLSIGYAVSVWNELTVPAQGLFKRIERSILLLVIVSLVASIATGPLVARYFNQVSLAGIISNLIVVPFAGFIVVPLGLVSGVLSLVLGHLPLPGLNQAAADLFYRMVVFFSRIPMNSFHPAAPGAVTLIAFGAFLVSAASLARARLFAALKPFESSQRVPKGAVIGMAASGTVLVVIAMLALLPGRSVRITFLDVGQGDSALIELPSGRNILIDGGGTHDNRFDMGRKVVAPYLWNRNVSKLDMVALSHPHPDHMNGLLFIANEFRINEFWDSGKDKDLPGYNELRRIMADRKIEAKTVTAGFRERVGEEAELEVLHPRAGKQPRFNGKEKEYEAENNRSLVMLAKLRDRTVLFTGDIGTAAVREILISGRTARCDILKVPHHGSKSSSPGGLLSLTRPSLAVVSVGKGNPYHHPASTVIESYARCGVRLYRTDRDGAVIVTIDKGDMRVMPWADMILRRIKLEAPANWGSVERENWKRAWERTWN